MGTMNCEEGVERAVLSWSRFAAAGQTALREALRVFNPISKDLLDTERQMLSFLQELKAEGHKPVVLRSKDVYGYRSCTTQPLTSEPGVRLPKTQKPCRKRGRKMMKNKHNKCTLLSPSAKAILQNQPKILLQNLSVDTLKQGAPFKSAVSPENSAQSLSQQQQQCLKLTSIKGATGSPTARLRIHFGAEAQSTNAPNARRPPVLSGIPRSPSETGGRTSGAVALDNKRGWSCPLKVDGALIGDSAPVVYQNGGMSLKEGGDKKVRMTPAEAESLSNGFDCSTDSEDSGPVRRLSCQSLGWSAQPAHVPNGRETVSRLNGKSSLEWKVIKVDESVTVDEVRREAQKILRVNLSPVIEIHPLVHSV